MKMKIKGNPHQHKKERELKRSHFFFLFYFGLDYLSLRIAIEIFSSELMSYLILPVVLLMIMFVGENPSNNSQNSSISRAMVLSSSPSKSAFVWTISY